MLSVNAQEFVKVFLRTLEFLNTLKYFNYVC